MCLATACIAPGLRQVLWVHAIRNWAERAHSSAQDNTAPHRQVISVTRLISRSLWMIQSMASRSTSLRVRWTWSCRRREKTHRIDSAFSSSHTTAEWNKLSTTFICSTRRNVQDKGELLGGAWQRIILGKYWATLVVQSTFLSIYTYNAF